jgi:D-alanine-D-alanine ligase
MDEGSFGIAQASIVDSDEKLADRVRFLHGRDADAIVEEYIEGREIYVGVLGNRRLEVLPIWELTFENLPAGAMAIATARVKHDPDDQERRGIRQQRAGAISPATEAAIVRTTRRIYRILSLDGYARLDYRLREDGTFFFLEGNPNPDLAQSQEFASVAEEAGLGYPALLERIVSLGMRRPVP